MIKYFILITLFCSSFCFADQGVAYFKNIHRDYEVCYPLPNCIRENREMTQQEKDELFEELTTENPNKVIPNA